MTKKPFHNCKGISFPDVMILISVLCAGAAFALPYIFQSTAAPAAIAKAQSDLQIIADAVAQLEKHSKIKAGYPGPNPCVNDPEFASLDTCRLGLKCNDGKYKVWKGPYIKEVPLDPWGRKYYMDNDYYQNGVVSRVLGSKGPNGVQDYDSSSDDIIHVLCREEKGPGV